jgi:hypothetical protein
MAVAKFKMKTFSNAKDLADFASTDVSVASVITVIYGDGSFTLFYLTP